MCLSSSFPSESDGGGDGASDLAPEVDVSKQRSFAETARMFKLRRNLDQLDSIHRQKEHDVQKTRSGPGTHRPPELTFLFSPDQIACASLESANTSTPVSLSQMVCVEVWGFVQIVSFVLFFLFSIIFALLPLSHGGNHFCTNWFSNLWEIIPTRERTFLVMTSPFTFLPCFYLSPRQAIKHLMNCDAVSIKNVSHHHSAQSSSGQCGALVLSD